MALSPEAMEALDPATDPQRLRDIAREHPALQPLVVTNPSCPTGIRDHILRTNAAAAQVYGAAYTPPAPGVSSRPADAAEQVEHAPSRPADASTQAAGTPSRPRDASEEAADPSEQQASAPRSGAAGEGPTTPEVDPDQGFDVGVTRLISVRDRPRADAPAITADDAWTALPGDTPITAAPYEATAAGSANGADGNRTGSDSSRTGCDFSRAGSDSSTADAAGSTTDADAPDETPVDGPSHRAGTTSEPTRRADHASEEVPGTEHDRSVAQARTPGERSPLSPATPAPSEDDLAATRALLPVFPEEDEEPIVRTAPVPPAIEHDSPPPTRLPRVTGYLASLPDAPADAWTEVLPASGAGSAYPGQGARSGQPYPAQGPATQAQPQGTQAPGWAPAAAQGASSYGSPAGYASPGYPSPSHASPSYGSPSYAAAGPGGPSGPSPRRKYALIGGLACLGLAVLLVIAVVAGVALSNRGGGDAAPSTSAPASESAPASSEAPTQSSAAPTDAPTSDAPAVALASPAPEGSLDLTQVRSPTGNITCDLADVSVGCSVVQRSYGAQDCPDPAAPFSVTVGDVDGPTLACGQAFGAPGTETATALDYGAVAAHGEVACRSESAGMTCWNQRTGHGFTLSRSSYAPF